MSSLDLFIVNLAFPYIGREYAGTSLSSLSWVLNGYTIVFAAVLVPAGRWADRVGRRRVFVAGLVAFSLGSLFCGLAPGVAALIAARVIQAAGAGLMVPASLSLLLAVGTGARPGPGPSGPGRPSAPSAPRSGRSSAGAWCSSAGGGCSGSTCRSAWPPSCWPTRVVPESKDEHVTGRPDLHRRRAAGRGRRPGRAGAGQGACLGMGLGRLRRPAARVAGLRRGHGGPVAPAPLPGDRARAAPLADIQRRVRGLDPLLRRVRRIRAQLGRVPDRGVALLRGPGRAGHRAGPAHGAPVRPGGRAAAGGQARRSRPGRGDRLPGERRAPSCSGSPRSRPTRPT